MDILMSKGRFLTKKKWRNGQRDCGHKAPPYSEMKYPRNSRFMKLFDGTHLAMKMSMRIKHIEWLRWKGF